MKKVLVASILFFVIFISNVSFSQEASTHDLTDLDKSEILDIRKELRDNISNLSLLKNDLKAIYTSMSASQSKERLLVMHFSDNIEKMKGIYAYVENVLQSLSLTKEDKIPYFRYVKGYSCEQMRRLRAQYINNMTRMHGQISSDAALRLIDKTIETIRSSSEVIDKAIEMVEQNIKQEETETERHKE